MIAYATEITKYLISRGCSKEDAEDCVQDTLEKIISLDVFVPPKNLRSWMYRVTIRDYYNKFNRRKKYESILLELSHEVKKFEDEELNSEIEEVISKLSSYQKEIIEKYYFEDYKVKELAEKYSTSLSKMKIDLYRARKKMKKIMKESGIMEWKI